MKRGVSRIKYMKTIKPLSFTVGITITLLVLAGLLIVVGIFNESLNWDIFGPKIEAFLYGIFGSSIALSCIGVAMTIVLGIQEIVKSFKAIENQHSTNRETVIEEAPRSTYFKYTLFLVILLALTVISLSLVDATVQQHRSNVFRRLISEQMTHFQPKLSNILALINNPPRDNVPQSLHDMITTLDNLSFVNTTTLYLPDPNDNSAMWRYSSNRDYTKEEGFSRFFVAKDFEVAMIKGLSGDESKLNEINKVHQFTWYYIVKNEKGKPIAAIKINGNSNENFREYLLGS